MKDFLCTWWKKTKQRGFLLWYAYKKRKENPLPKVVHPYHVGIQVRQKKILISFLIPFLFIAFYSYWFISHQREQNEIVNVYVMAEDVKAPVVITSSMIQRGSFTQKSLPEGAFKRSSDIVGKSFVRDKYKNEIVHAKDLSAETNPKSVSSQFTELFALSVDESWFESKFPNIKTHDRVDIIAVNPAGEGIGTSNIIEYAEVLDVRTFSGTRTLTLNVDQSQARSLLFARGIRIPLQVLVYPGGYQRVETSIPNLIPDENSESSEREE